MTTPITQATAQRASLNLPWRVVGHSGKPARHVVDAADNIVAHLVGRVPVRERLGAEICAAMNAPRPMPMPPGLKDRLLV